MATLNWALETMDKTRKRQKNGKLFMDMICLRKQLAPPGGWLINVLSYNNIIWFVVCSLLFVVFPPIIACGAGKR